MIRILDFSPRDAVRAIKFRGDEISIRAFGGQAYACIGRRVALHEHAGAVERPPDC